MKAIAIISTIFFFIIPLMLLVSCDTFSIVFCIAVEIATAFFTFFLWKEVRSQGVGSRKHEKQYNQYINRNK